MWCGCIKCCNSIMKFYHINEIFYEDIKLCTDNERPNLQKKNP